MVGSSAINTSGSSASADGDQGSLALAAGELVRELPRLDLGIRDVDLPQQLHDLGVELARPRTVLCSRKSLAHLAPHLSKLVQ